MATLEPVKQVLVDSGLSASNLDEILLVGGSTRIPKIQQLVQDFFGGKVIIYLIYFISLEYHTHLKKH